MIKFFNNNLGLPLLLLIMICGSGYCAEENAKHLTISGIVNEQTHVMAKEVLRVAYNRIGYHVDFLFVPGKRSLEMANKGESDGDIARIQGTAQKYTNLLQLSTPVSSFKGVAFTKTVTKKINSWDDLDGLRIGIIRGIRYSTIGTKERNPYFADDMTHLFHLLEDGRIEVAIAVLNAGRIELHSNFRESGIHVTGTPLYSAPLYHFVHKKNMHLVDDLDTVLEQMAARGEIESILDATLAKLLSN